MFGIDKFRLYVFLFLAFSVLSSKHILIYNEETLVTLSFFSFIFFIAHYFGNTIQESLSERSVLIQQELQNFLQLRESSFIELLKEHQRVSDLAHTMKNLNAFTYQELSTLNHGGEKSLINLFTDQLEQKMKTLGFSSLLIQQKLQQSLSDTLLSHVLLALQTNSPMKSLSGSISIPNQSKTLREAIDLLLVNTKTQ